VPGEYLGLVHQLHTTDINIRSARQIPQFLQSSTGATQLDELVNYFITTQEDLIVSPSINLRVRQIAASSSSTTNNSNSTTSADEHHYVIELYSYELTFKQLKATISDWMMAYRNHIKNKNKGKLMHFSK
jgi:hypothetical protein